MTTIEKSVVGIITACVVTALGWSASTVLDVKTKAATLDVRLTVLEGRGDPNAHLATIDAKLDALKTEVEGLRSDLAKRK